ncbi:MAG: RraA family protein [Bacteroidia bacterium]|nr:RraA family protein [Bacteroidia bacterium]
MKKLSSLLLLAFFTSFAYQAVSQIITKEELIFLTSEWKGERFPDGRPKISDELIARARKIGIEEAWQILNNEGYKCQYEGNWKMIHDDVPVIGRAVTATFIPTRPDLDKNIKERGSKNGFAGATNAWPISVLQKGDVYVASCFGKINGGTMIGDNLGTSIFAKTGNGVIFDAAARDLTGLEKIEGFNAYVHDFHPSFLVDVVLGGLNTPTRIGGAVVLPGDLVISDREGVLFIPAHMAEKVIATAEFINLRDKYSKTVLKSGKFTAGQIDAEWTSEIREDFLKWLGDNPSLGKMTRAELDEFMKKRTW